jgi:hypothetical protein
MMVENCETSECTLEIHRPVSLQVILDISMTPMMHPHEDHECCAQGAAPEHLVKAINGAMLPIECAEIMEKPNPRGVETIRKVYCMYDGCILDTQLSNECRIRTSTRLHLTDIQHFHVWDGDFKCIDTALRLLQVPARDPPTRDPLPSLTLRQPRGCRYKQGRNDMDLNLLVFSRDAERFLGLVSTVPSCGIDSAVLMRRVRPGSTAAREGIRDARDSAPSHLHPTQRRVRDRIFVFTDEQDGGNVRGALYVCWTKIPRQ